MDDTAARIAEARKSGKLGTPQEASLYAWREVIPLGIVGFQQKDAQTGEVTDVRQVRFKSTLTRREFSAVKGTRFGDATLVNVTSAGVVFSDTSGTHEVGWSRSKPPATQVPPQPFAAPVGAGGNYPSGYAEQTRPLETRRP